MGVCQRCIEVVHLGQMRYNEALRMQNQCAKSLIDRISGKPVTTKSPLSNGENKLLLVEHDPVYTVGLRRENYSTEIIDKLKTLGADFEETNRGGLITFHGPGQMVAYPILHMKQFQVGMRLYIEQLESVVIDTCRHLGIDATRSSDTGIWVENEKIAAIGVHGSRYVTTHGLALNCNTDLSWFDHTVPCGLVDKGVTSLTALLGREVAVSEMTDIFLKEFAKTFNCTLFFR